MKKLLGVCLTLTFVSGLMAQSLNPWNDATLASMRNTDQRVLFPNLFRTVTAQSSLVSDFLQGVQNEADISPLVNGSQFIVPDPDGSWDTFAIVRYQMMEPGLAARYPEFVTFRGVDIHDPFKTIRGDWTVKGFTAIVNSSQGRYHIEPFARNNTNDYISFYKRDYPLPLAEFECGTKTETIVDPPIMRVTGDCTFRSYRLAVAATGEYSNHFGADSPSDEAIVLAEVVIAVNRVNEVFEKDFTVRLILIENTTEVFYYNPGTDPYSGSACTQLGQNVTNMNNVIGSGNYDVGHVFSVGSGGCAGLAVICSNNNKARGATGLNPPDGDPFYIDYVAHELGHQFGANHTQNNNCNRVSHAAREPGSASTIMGYAGICSPNVQDNSDDYFHGYSIQEINNHISGGGGGNGCDTPISFNNDPPEVSPGSDYTIPVSTPFMLTADATDPDGDPMTYCWEQWDQEVGNMPPQSTNTVGPMFRSLDPDPSPTRYFPRLSDLVNNTDYDWEELPSVSREMEFRVTVRDFHNSMAGCTDEDNVLVTTTASSGPFLVTSPNTSTVEWPEGAVETVTWNVANTTNSPVSCASVDIYLSYDGGFTYTDTLASGVTNDGSHDIIVPAGTTTTARVMVRGAGNIFFDISDEDFEIISGIPNYVMSVSPDFQVGCPPDDAEYTVAVESILGYDDPVTLNTSGVPAGASVSFTPNPVIPGNSSLMTVSLNGGVADGDYIINVQGTSVAGPQTVPVGLSIGTPDVALLSPADGETGVPTNVLLSWETFGGATSAEVEVSSDEFFNIIVFTASTSSPGIEASGLNAASVYYWRVRPSNVCGPGAWSEARIFQTGNCNLTYSTDVPKNISSSGSPTITSVLNIGTNGTINDVNVIDLEGMHTYLDDLRFTVVSPAETEVIIINRWCGSENNFDINLDDEAPPGDAPCPYNDGGTYQPEQALSAFDGENPLGTWTLVVDDLANQDGGQLQSWALEICMSGSCPLTIANNDDNGMGSLRNALACASPGDTIRFAEGLDGSTIILQSTLFISSDIVISVPQGMIITIDGGNIARTMRILSDTDVTLERLRITAGNTSLGSGIINEGNLFLKDVVIQPGNQSGNDLLYNIGSISLEGNCQVLE